MRTQKITKQNFVRRLELQTRRAVGTTDPSLRKELRRYVRSMSPSHDMDCTVMKLRSRHVRLRYDLCESTRKAYAAHFKLVCRVLNRHVDEVHITKVRACHAMPCHAMQLVYVQWTYDDVESALKKLRFVHKWGDVHTPLVLTKLSRFGQFISAVKFQYADAYFFCLFVCLFVFECATRSFSCCVK